jgi:hypothetical protein
MGRGIMPNLATTVATTTHEEVQIRPVLRTKLKKRLLVYAELRTQIKALEAALDKEKGEIGKIREEVGATSLSLDGFKVTQVTNTRSTLDKKKLIAMGVTTDMLEEATTHTPGRPYEKITCPGERGKDDE